jgi:hypothetical protein
VPGNIIPANRAAATAASKANLRMSFLPATQSNNYLREARAGPCAKSTCIVSVASAKAFMLPVAAHPPLRQATHRALFAGMRPKSRLMQINALARLQGTLSAPNACIGRSQQAGVAP